jgi:hypothetical protein
MTLPTTNPAAQPGVGPGPSLLLPTYLQIYSGDGSNPWGKVYQHWSGGGAPISETNPMTENVSLRWAYVGGSTGDITQAMLQVFQGEQTNSLPTDWRSTDGLDFQVPIKGVPTASGTILRLNFKEFQRLLLFTSWSAMRIVPLNSKGDLPPGHALSNPVYIEFHIVH